MWDIVSQIGIAILAPAAIIVVAKKNRWGFVIGLASQPFFFITSIINHQWGLFITAVIYTMSWIYGIYEWFFKNKIIKSR